MHARQQIRVAVVARLTGATAAGANVFGKRVYPLTVDQLPAILVNTDDEEVAEWTVRNVMRRSLTVTVEGLVKKSGTGLDDELDALAEQIESAAENSAALLPGSQTQIALTGISVDATGEGEDPMAKVVLTYRVDYLTQTAAPGTAL